MWERSARKIVRRSANDRHTTLQESRQVFNAAPEPKELWVVKDAPHVDLYNFARTEYERRILEFFGKHLRQTGNN